MHWSNKKTKRKHRHLKRSKPKIWCQVYVLHAGDGLPRYVGQTTLVPEDRLKYHLNDVGKRRARKQRLSPVGTWISGLMASGRYPVLDIIDPNGIWDVSEAVWIDRLRRRGADLLNVLALVDGESDRWDRGCQLPGYPPLTDDPPKSLEEMDPLTAAFKAAMS